MSRNLKAYTEDELDKFLNEFDFPFVNVTQDYILIGDSILRNIDNINNTQVMSYPGSGLFKMELLIKHGKIPELKNKKMLIFHLGTNDASNPKIKVPDLIEMTLKLINSVRELTPQSKIVLSHIIPRPCDFETTNCKIKEYNNLVHTNCIKWGISTIPTYETLQFAGIPIDIFYRAKDGLHLSEIGEPRVRMALSKGIAKERIKSKWRRTKQKAPETIIRESLSTRMRKERQKAMRLNKLRPGGSNRIS